MFNIICVVFKGKKLCFALVTEIFTRMCTGSNFTFNRSKKMVKLFKYIIT